MMQAYKHSGEHDSEFQLVRSMNNLASALQLSGSPKGVGPLLESALGILQKIPGNRMDTKERNSLIAYTEINFGWVLLHQHRDAEAEKHISPIGRSQSNEWPYFAAKSLLAGISLERKNGGDPSNELLEGYEGMIKIHPPDTPPLEMACLDKTAAWLFDFYRGGKHPEKGERVALPEKARIY